MLSSFELQHIRDPIHVILVLAKNVGISTFCDYLGNYVGIYVVIDIGIYFGIYVGIYFGIYVGTYVGIYFGTYVGVYVNIFVGIYVDILFILVYRFFGTRPNYESYTI